MLSVATSREWRIALQKLSIFVGLCSKDTENERPLKVWSMPITLDNLYVSFCAYLGLGLVGVGGQEGLAHYRW